MNLNLSGHHLVITPAIRSYVTAKLDRVTRHFDHVIDLGAMFTGLGLTNVKTLGVRLTRGEIFRKRNVLVFERR